MVKRKLTRKIQRGGVVKKKHLTQKVQKGGNEPNNELTTKFNNIRISGLTNLGYRCNSLGCISRST